MAVASRVHLQVFSVGGDERVELTNARALADSPMESKIGRPYQSRWSNVLGTLVINWESATVDLLFLCAMPEANWITELRVCVRQVPYAWAPR